MHAPLGQICSKRLKESQKNSPLLKSLQQKQGVSNKSRVLSVKLKVSVAQSCPLRPHGLHPDRLFCPWNSLGKNTGVGSHSLLQGIFPTQGLNPGPCTPYKEQIQGASKQENLLFVLTPLCYSGSPSKALPELLVWPLVNFYLLKKAKNPSQ